MCVFVFLLFLKREFSTKLSRGKEKWQGRKEKEREGVVGKGKGGGYWEAP